jgi:spermidine synthase
MNGTEQLIFSPDALEFVGYPSEAYIMHRSEDRAMRELARLACQNGGDILEIGFGMGISAGYVQSNPITSHTIIELHPDIHARALIWAKDKPNVTVILGDWYSILPSMNRVFDGVLHDTYGEVNFREFFKVVPSVCKNGTIIVVFEYPYKDVPMSRVDIQLTDDERLANPIPNITKFTLGWNTYVDGEFLI